MSRTPSTVSAETALAAVKEGMTVVAASLSSEPSVLLGALASRAKEIGIFTLVSGMLLDGYEILTPQLGHNIRFVTWFMPQTLLGDVGLGPHVDFLPLSWVQTYRYLSEREFDVCLIQVSPKNESGYYSVGISASATLAMARQSKVVIAQVNQEMPYTNGETLLHESEIDFLVEGTRPLHSFPHRTPDARDAAIAQSVASLIPDGATVQAGIGTVPEAVLRNLLEQRRSGLMLTSQLTDAGRALIDGGCCRDDGPAAVVGEVLGSTELYRWVSHNERIELRNALETHSLEALRERRNFVSINSTLEVDLYGQLNSEVMHSGQAGGIGGSVDFMMGAQFAEGRSVIALPSMTGRGKSRIVPVITTGLVTVPRSLVQFVVTENGVADLRGRTARERALAIAEISHEDARDELLAAAARIA